MNFKIIIASVALLIPALCFGMRSRVRYAQPVSEEEIVSPPKESIAKLDQRIETIVKRATDAIALMPQNFVREAVQLRKGINNLAKQLELLSKQSEQTMLETGKTAAEEIKEYKKKLSEYTQKIYHVLNELEKHETEWEQSVAGMNEQDRKELERRLMIGRDKFIDELRNQLNELSELSKSK